MQTRGKGHTHTASDHQRQYSDEEREFLAAVIRYRQSKHRPFPTLCELLSILKGLGWRKERS